jgi:hypothetical protein
MRFFALLILNGLFVVPFLPAQTIDVSSSKKTGLPMYRPALLGSGKNSLVNRIDTQGLIRQGQKDAAIMFSCSVRKNGEIAWSGTYRGTPDSKLLEQEVRKRLAETKFIPAVYNHAPVDAIYYGTVTFAVMDGKPRLRIFSNQETEELKKESDFVGPQPFFGKESKFTGLHYPSDTPVVMDAVVEVKLKVDATGALQEFNVIAEEPPFIGFGDAARVDFYQATFIPAFRDGKPVACEISLPVFYKTR